MNQRSVLALSACLAALFFFSMTHASAQVNTADILGTVSDAGGAVVPGVRVAATNMSTNDVKTASTNTTGEYIFNLMPPGQYTITGESPSFKKATISLSVSAGDRARADMQLQVGNVTEVIQVEAQSPEIGRAHV